MAMLHIVNKSPFDGDSLKACIRLAISGSSVLLTEDGVYGAMKGSTCSDAVSNSMKETSFYALGPDLKARGVTEDKLIDGVKVVDYTGFVNLVIENDNLQSWL
ncbi:tRNA 5-methylaminomethyl-2-thiouridine synthase subunit TusB [hydrothermal vent metagenome]|uniref:tRNA 5-methylaminomethyl-2-thiouridine synthase subunit TusB n=1 Tax=hydrothermal vent metagenome TaxID=652676 RepID=A0A3B1A218_9ZZZZ